MKSFRLSDGVTQKYRLPSNLIETDAVIFKDDLERECPDSAIICHQNVFINNNGVIISGFWYKRSNLTDSNKWLAEKMVSLQTFARVVKNIQFLTAGDRHILPYDNWSYNYFHFLLDLLPKLFYARNLNIDPVVVLPDRLPSSFILFLQQIGFQQVKVIRKHKWAFFRKLLVPELIFRPSGVFNQQYLLPFRDWLNEVTASAAETVAAQRKIYLSRRNATSRRVINEDIIASVLAANGFEIHCAENMTIMEQVSLFRETGVFLSAHGAGLSNMLFMPAGAIVIELRLETPMANNTYFRLASSLNHRYYYLKCTGDREEFQEANLFVDSTKLIELIKTLPNNAGA